MNELKLADLGEGMHEAEIVEWLAQVGEYVRLDQPVVRVETDKAVVEIPSPVAGHIREVYFQPGEMAKVGEVLASYTTEPTQMTSAPSPAQKTPVPAARAEAPQAAMPAASEKARANGAGARVLAAPAVRKLAFELGIDLARIKPSADRGRVTLEDVRAYAAQASPAARQPAQAPAPAAPEQTGRRVAPLHPGSGQAEKGERGDARKALVGLRRQIAEHMERSWRTIPHATAFEEVDAVELIALRQELLSAAEKRGVRLTYMPLLLKLLIPLLKEFPIFNASLDEQTREIVYKKSYHIGIATATDEGLLVPVLHDVDRLSMTQLAERLEQLTERAKTRTLALNETRGSTFTLNNIGSFGGSSGTPIINYPNSAILATGRIEEKAVVRSGAILALPRMPLTLSFDHRLIDGAQCGAFLARLKELIEHPRQLLLDMI